MFNYFINRLRKFVSIFLTVTILSFSFFSKTFSSENVFAVDNIEVTGNFNTNFSREKYINKAFLDSFKILMSKILLSEDLVKLNDVELNQIKVLVNSFKIEDEIYSKKKYKGNFTIFFDDVKVKKLLIKKNISFSQPKNISAVFFPVLYISGELQSLKENFFYNNWKKVKIKNELINFILPIEDLDDITQITKKKNNLEDLDIQFLVDKYEEKNYVFVLMDYESNNLNIYLKTNFNNNKTSRNISYRLKNIKDEQILHSILKDLKIEIIDLWKEENLINLLMPLSIRVQYQYKDLKDLDKLRNILYNMSIINSYTLEEFNIKNSFFKIYYYGEPKKLKSELSKFGYNLKNDQVITLNHERFQKSCLPHGDEWAGCDAP